MVQMDFLAANHVRIVGLWQKTGPSRGGRAWEVFPVGMTIGPRENVFSGPRCGSRRACIHLLLCERE